MSDVTFGELGDKTFAESNWSWEDGPDTASGAVTGGIAWTGYFSSFGYEPSIGYNDSTITYNDPYITYNGKVQTRKGASTGALVWSGTATGIAQMYGGAAGLVGWYGHTTGGTVTSGTVAAAVEWAGSIEGGTFNSGTSTATVSWSGATAGSSGSSAIVSGVLNWAGAASGATDFFGSTNASIEWAGSVSGNILLAGVATGSVAWDGDVLGTTETNGSATGHVSWQGDVSGIKILTGVATGDIFWAGDTAGYTAPFGITLGILDWAGELSGFIGQFGSTTGQVVWEGDMSGGAPAYGDAAGQVNWVVDAANGFAPGPGLVEGHLLWTGDIAGYKPTVAGILNPVIGDSSNVSLSPYSPYSDGAATSIGHTRPDVPLRERILNTNNLTSAQEAMLRAVMDVPEMDGVLDLDTEIYQWAGVLRSVDTNDNVTTYSHSNSSPDYERMIFRMKHTGGKIKDLLYNMHPASINDKMLVATDPNSSSLGNKSYAPALPTTNLTDMLRGISQSLGLPLVDTFKHLVLFDGYKEIFSSAFQNFQTNAESPSSAQAEAAISWYETKIETGKFVIYKSEDVISIEADQTVEVVVQMEGTPKNIDTFIPAVGAIPFAGGEPNVTSSMVCVTGSDGYIVSPQRWNDLGGRITVRRGAGPFDLVLTITGPSDKGSSPFTLTEGADRPALYVVSNGGLSFRQREVRMGLAQARAKPWRGDDDYQEAQAIVSPEEMPYVDTTDRAYSALVRKAGQLTGPLLTCSGVLPVQRSGSHFVAAGVSIPTLPAKKFYLEYNMWRITDTSWDADAATVNVSAKAGLTFDDFNDNYKNASYIPSNDKYTVDTNYKMSFSDFNSAMARSGVQTFGDLNVAPLIVRPEGL